MKKVAIAGYLSLPSMFSCGIACNNFGPQIQASLFTCLSLGHHVMKEAFGDGGGKKQQYFCDLAYLIPRRCTVGLWGLPISGSSCTFLRTCICTKHFPHNFNPYYKALIGMCDTLAIQVSLRGKPRILYPNACLIPKPSKRIRSSKLSHPLAGMLPFLIFLYS